MLAGLAAGDSDRQTAGGITVKKLLSWARVAHCVPKLFHTGCIVEPVKTVWRALRRQYGLGHRIADQLGEFGRIFQFTALGDDGQIEDHLPIIA